jgi:homocysteine S-methyltransferase
MSNRKYRHRLPQLRGGLFLSDGGIETTLIFHEGIELPHFAAFVLMDSEGGAATLRRYFEPYLQVARERGVGMVLESPTWRASADWGAKLGYSRAQLRRINQQSIELLAGLREEWEAPGTPLVLSGAIGPRGDGYKAGRASAEEAEEYHSEQIAAFADSAADLVTAYTMNSIAEGIGVARAARRMQVPAAISFTLETDGRLATGESLREAIEAVDADTDGWPAYYMINCAHPLHFAPALQEDAAWTRRILGIKANASQQSHAELDEATVLDDGDPADLGQRYRTLTRQYPGLRILGGCCGTDHRHVAAICDAVRSTGRFRVISSDAA